MALINCPECGARISDTATACPKCGCPNSPTYHNGSKKHILTIGIVFILVIVVILAYSILHTSDDENYGRYKSPDLAFFCLKGNVESYKEQSNNGDGWSKGFNNYFNEKGEYDIYKSQGGNVYMERNSEGLISRMGDSDSYGSYFTDYAWDNACVIEERFHHNGNSISWTCLTNKHYDKDGNLEYEDWLHGADEDAEFRDGKTRYTNYVFDDNGNWISVEVVKSFEYKLHGESLWRKKEIRTLKKRSISYYD